jgi:hypothetical protein
MGVTLILEGMVDIERRDRVITLDDDKIDRIRCRHLANEVAMVQCLRRQNDQPHTTRSFLQ